MQLRGERNVGKYLGLNSRLIKREVPQMSTTSIRVRHAWAARVDRRGRGRGRLGDGDGLSGYCRDCASTHALSPASMVSRQNLEPPQTLSRITTRH